MLLLQKYDLEIFYKQGRQQIIVDHVLKINTGEASTDIIDTFLNTNLFMV